MQLIRPAATDDIEAITAIYRRHVLTGTASFEEVPPDAADMAARFAAIQERGLPYLCLEDVLEAGSPPRLLGYAYAGPYRPRTAYRFTVEDSIYLAPEAAGRGYGKLLLTKLIEECRARELREIVAVIGDSSNHASIALHRRLGFRDVGILQQVGLKFGRWLDTVLMQLTLQD
ncbi:MAG TPA: GNAT family N-acetyltransferase [Candidatus Nitrosotalea sp.]|jgi:L-amino acid N-acyltransferase YncA|nr:GNAT family N-acetyltransferase [Candidatus Nitrosotalea sp.]